MLLSLSSIALGYPHSRGAGWVDAPFLKDYSKSCTISLLIIFISDHVTNHKSQQTQNQIHIKHKTQNGHSETWAC